MSKKRNVAFIKPEEPSFLKKLKAQVGYQEGPTIDTKREELETADEDGIEENEEEQPTVVVLKSGDLTAEEVAAEKLKMETEAATAPADLSKPIVFKAPIKKKTDDTKNGSSKRSKKTAKKVVDQRLLSFDNEEEDV